MCALFGSPDRKTFVELSKLNVYRGSHSYSVATFDGHNINVVAKNFGSFDMPNVIDSYYIGHTQAPTTEAKSTNSIHPSNVENTFLWHNGIIKDHQVKKWQRKLNLLEPWDTKLLHQLLFYNGIDILSGADGSFACVWWTGKSLYLFRNTNCPLFTDGTSYSSTKFSGSYPLNPDIIYELTLNGIRQTQLAFETKNNFYWSID
jgi:glutamine phosphoribosylpyrophosphate amidotransferase